MGNANQEKNDRENGAAQAQDQQGTSKESGQSSGGGTATGRAQGGDESTASGAYKNETGDPGRTPGSAEGVEDFEKTGNE